MQPDTNIRWRSRIRLVDEVADVLRSEIFAGRLPLGTPLRQEQLATMLDVSRTPLREALRMLEREGLVRVEPGRSVRVISGDLSTLRAAYALREVVDGLAARLAAQRADEAALERLDDIVARQRNAFQPWEPTLYTATNVEFHAAVMEAAGNEFLLAQLPLVHVTSQVFIPIARVDEHRAERAIEEHTEIITAIGSGEAEEAEQLAREHIRKTIRSLAEARGGDDGTDHARPDGHDGGRPREEEGT
jgi:DNA-binding GntR family transcriptional regulator